MNALSQVETFRRFSIDGVNVQIDRLPEFSEKAQCVMRAHGFVSPRIESKTLKNYMFELQDLADTQELRKDRKKLFYALILGVALVATSVLVGFAIMSNLLKINPFLLLLGLPLGTLGLLIGGLLSIVAGGCLISSRNSLIERKQKELECLKPEVQQYLEQFVRYCQWYGPTLQKDLENALSRLQEEGMRENELSSEKQRVREELTAVLEEIRKASDRVAQTFGEPGKALELEGA